MPILAVFLCALPLLPQDPDLKPKVEDCRLLVQGKELGPLRGDRYDGWSEFAQEGWRVRLTPTVAWIARDSAPDQSEPVELQRPRPGRELHTLTISADTAFLTDPEADKPRLLRLDLKQRKWLAEWELGDEALGLEKSTLSGSRITSSCASGSALYVLRSDDSDGYAVARLELSTGKAVWARRFRCTPPPQESGAVLMAPMLTAPSCSWPRELQVLDGHLIVCARGAESILRLESVKGATVWSIDRIWEFERGYVGPSVWSHYLARFRAGPFEDFGENAKVPLEDRRKAFDALHTGSIVAGPFAVEKFGRRDERCHGLLVVAALAPVDAWGAQFTQQFLYEIDERGRPVSVVALPRAVLGWAAATIQDRVVLGCMRGAFVCASITENTGDLDMGVGSGPDATGRLCWYRELVPGRQAAWMRCDPSGDPIALDERLGIRVAGGGWIAREGDTLFHFPLWLVDPREGSAREVELRVPFEGSMTVPNTNYHTDGKTIETWGPRGLALRKLELAGDRLLVWLANSKQVWKLEFDVRELMPAK